MFIAVEMIPHHDIFLERNIRQGGYISKDAAETAVLRKGTGFVKHYESGKIVSVVINGRIFVIDQEKLNARS